MNRKKYDFQSERLIFRNLRIQDSELILSWRNTARILSVSRNKSIITVENHKKWFHSTRESRHDYLFLDKYNGEPIGVISLEKNNLNSQDLNSFELSKYIGNTNYLGKGIAYEATKTSLNYFKNKEIVEFFYSITQIDNVINIKLNEKIGFKIEDFPDYLNYDSSAWVYMKMEIK